MLVVGFQALEDVDDWMKGLEEGRMRWGPGMVEGMAEGMEEGRWGEGKAEGRKG